MEFGRCTDPTQNLDGMNWEFVRCYPTGGAAGHPHLHRTLMGFMVLPLGTFNLQVH